MSNTYHPDKWVVFELKGDDPHYRVLAGFYGGYLDGDHWRLNSGITKVEADGDYLLFEGQSGSMQSRFLSRMSGCLSPKE